MPGWSKLSGCEGQITWKDHERNVFKVYAESVSPISMSYDGQRLIWNDDRYGNDFADLMNGLLVLNPSNRLTAQQALDHEWFWKDPMPTEPSQYVLPISVL